MPRFGGFNVGNIGGALARNAIGSIANAVLPRSVFGGFGVGGGTGLNGQRGTQDSTNRRVSLRPKPAAASRVYGNGLLKPLAETGGLVWPYTPTISYQHPIDYQTIATTHANQDFHVYAKTPAVKLQVSGEFSVQNQLEGQYALAAIHFLRTMAKMNFGENDVNAGTPPPVLLFSAYGAFVFGDTPVILNDFSVEFPDNVDYVQVSVVGSAGTRIIAGSAGRAATPGTSIAPAVITSEPLRPTLTTEAPSAEADAARADRTPLARGVPNPSPGVFNPASSGAVANTGFAQNRTFRIPGIAGTPGSPAVIGTPSQTVPVPQTYTVWLPSLFKITCTLVIQHTPEELRKRFNLPAFINGAVNQKDFV